MNKYFYISLLLMTIIVLGSFSGAYAILTNYSNGGKIIYVNKMGTDRNDGLTPTTPKMNIESAWNAAASGDTIMVASGVYSTHLHIDKNITLIGDSQENTVLDANHTQQNCIEICPGITASITGFTIKNGGKQDFKNFGGGIHNNGILTLINSTCTENTADHGGGISNYGVLTMKGCTIKNNRGLFGGGISNSVWTTLSMEDSVIMDNQAIEDGGGIYNFGSLVISNVIIKNNQAMGSGGGICNFVGLTVKDSSIMNNIAKRLGGGISNRGTFNLYSSVIAYNRAGDDGGISNKYICYMDVLSRVTDNQPTDFAGNPVIPA